MTFNCSSLINCSSKIIIRTKGRHAHLAEAGPVSGVSMSGATSRNWILVMVTNRPQPVTTHSISSSSCTGSMDDAVVVGRIPRSSVLISSYRCVCQRMTVPDCCVAWKVDEGCIDGCGEQPGHLAITMVQDLNIHSAPPLTEIKTNDLKDILPSPSSDSGSLIIPSLVPHLPSCYLTPHRPEGFFLDLYWLFVRLFHSRFPNLAPLRTNPTTPTLTALSPQQSWRPLHPAQQIIAMRAGSLPPAAWDRHPFHTPALKQAIRKTLVVGVRVIRRWCRNKNMSVPLCLLLY